MSTVVMSSVLCIELETNNKNVHYFVFLLSVHSSHHANLQSCVWTVDDEAQIGGPYATASTS